MKKTLQTLIMLIMVAVSYDASACNITPVITAGGPLTFCYGDWVVLSTNSYVSYLWSTGDTTQFINAHVSGNYTVYVTDINGCTGTSVATVVIVNPLPNATITPSGFTTFCLPGSITLTSSIGVSYLWSDGETTQSIVDSITNGFSVYVTDNNGCSAYSNYLWVTADTILTPIITPHWNFNLCFPDSVIMTVSAGNSYLWSTGATTQSITVDTAGTFTVYVDDGNGCAGTSAPAVVTVSDSITNSPCPIVGNTIIQMGSTQTYSVTPVTGATSYTWTLPGGWTGSSTSASITITVGAAGGCVSAIANSGCGSSGACVLCTHVYSGNCFTMFDLFPDTAILHHYFITDTIIGVSPFQYNWSWGDGNFDTIAYPSHTYADSGIYNICLTITDSNGCQSHFCYNNYHILRSMSQMVQVDVVHSLPTDRKS